MARVRSVQQHLQVLDMPLPIRILIPILIHITDAQLWKTKFAEAQEIVRTKCCLYSQSHEGSSDEESSITRSEDTNTPEPKVLENSPNKDKEGLVSEEKDPNGVVLKLKELKVDNGKAD